MLMYKASLVIRKQNVSAENSNEHLGIPLQEEIQHDTLSANATEKHEVIPMMELEDVVNSSVPVACKRNFEISSIKFKECCTDVTTSTNCTITPPKLWSFAELNTEKGSTIVISFLASNWKNGNEAPVIEKSIMVDTNNALRLH